MATSFTTVEEYLAALPGTTREALEEVLQTVRAALPDAEETISYQIPTFRVAGKAVVYAAGWQRHLSLYPVPEGDADLLAELAPYVASRGTLKFPLGRPVPHDLVARVVRALLDDRTRPD